MLHQPVWIFFNRSENLSAYQISKQYAHLMRSLPGLRSYDKTLNRWQVRITTVQNSFRTRRKIKAIGFGIFFCKN